MRVPSRLAARKIEMGFDWIVETSAIGLDGLRNGGEEVFAPLLVHQSIARDSAEIVSIAPGRKRTRPGIGFVSRRLEEARAVEVAGEGAARRIGVLRRWSAELGRVERADILQRSADGL